MFLSRSPRWLVLYTFSSLSISYVLNRRHFVFSYQTSYSLQIDTTSFVSVVTLSKRIEYKKYRLNIVTFSIELRLMKRVFSVQSRVWCAVCVACFISSRHHECSRYHMCLCAQVLFGRSVTIIDTVSLFGRSIVLSCADGCWRFPCAKMMEASSENHSQRETTTVFIGYK